MWCKCSLRNAAQCFMPLITLKCRVQKRHPMLCVRCEEATNALQCNAHQMQNSRTPPYAKCLNVRRPLVLLCVVFLPPRWVGVVDDLFATHIGVSDSHNLDFSATSPLMRERDRVDDLRRSAPSLAFLVFARRSTGISSSSDSSTVNRSGDGSRHE
jgi:hypothetical protein